MGLFLSRNEIESEPPSFVVSRRNVKELPARIGFSPVRKMTSLPELIPTHPSGAAMSLIDPLASLMVTP
jgi:hypothetical protein